MLLRRTLLAVGIAAVAATSACYAGYVDDYGYGYGYPTASVYVGGGYWPGYYYGGYGRYYGYRPYGHVYRAPAYGYYRHGYYGRGYYGRPYAGGYGYHH